MDKESILRNATLAQVLDLIEAVVRSGLQNFSLITDSFELQIFSQQSDKRNQTVDVINTGTTPDAEGAQEHGVLASKPDIWDLESAPKARVDDVFERTSASESSDSEPKLESSSILSPIVGIYYSAPEPGGTPYVCQADNICMGQTVGVIETMKVFTPVEAPRDGVISAILVHDGQLVEEGDVLMHLVPL